MVTIADHELMARALRLAEQGRYTAHPNPRVGCVIGRGEHIVGEGFHRQTGGPHAEVEALEVAGDAARGATAYVTLEPCCFQGRTPPCTDALITAGLARVLVATEDPNPQVRGQGVKWLREAGIKVEVGLLETQARAINAGFIQRMTSGRPRVTVKLAASLDGRTAMASGESQWITGEAARADVQRLRAQSGAILTGRGTAQADDPSLNVRNESIDTLGRQPLRAVVDTTLSLSLASKMLSLEGETRVFTAKAEPDAQRALEAVGAVVESVGLGPGGVDLAAVLKRLGELEINDVLVEAGPTLTGALMAAGLVDELVLYLAPHLMGDDSRGLFSLPALRSMADRVELSVRDLRQVGQDLRITASVARSEGAAGGT